MIIDYQPRVGLFKKRYRCDRHFSEFWRQKSTGINMERNYVTVTFRRVESDQPQYTALHCHSPGDTTILSSCTVRPNAFQSKHACID